MHSTVDWRVIVSDEGAPFAERLAAAVELGRAGDERATATDRVTIPAGPFLCGGHFASPEDGREPAPPRRVRLSAFAIDRYPVTVVAFARFLDAGGYKERRHWSRAGWNWRTRERIEKPRFWGEAEWASYLVPNHPVVGVSVYEAEAYASFAGARLPTEAEWEKACRGIDGRRYPWGSEWVEDACGERGKEPKGTVPIGVYPKGVSPYGVMDLLGCAWQWCADAGDDDADPGDEDPFVDPEGYDESTERITRGGGWNNLRWSISAVAKNAYPPTARFSNLGFRCASSPENP